MNRVDLQKLAEMRIDEALALLNAKKYSGAYYLAGYAVECGLKACIAKRTRRHGYPDKDLANKCYTHDVEKLVDVAGLKAALQGNSQLLLCWAVVKDWSEQARYEKKSRAEAKALYDAIMDPANGIMQWIKSHW